MAKYYWSIVVALFVALPDANAQQYNSNWDAQITRLETEGQADSVIFYYRLKANYYKQVDSLEAWTYCFYECQFLYSDDKRALSFLDTVVQQKWRRPRTAAEAEALALVQAGRGFYLFNIGNILGAIQAQEEGLHLYNKYKFKDFDALEYFFKPLIANYTRLGDNEKARVIFQMAIRSDPSGGTSGALAGLYNNIGLTYWNEGNYEKAIAFYRKGLKCIGAAPDKTALLQSSLAASLLESGRLEEADNWLKKAITNLERLPLSDDNRETVCDYLSGAYQTKARLLRQQGRYADALHFLQRAWSSGLKAKAVSSPRDLAKIWIAFGELYLERNEIDQAIAAYNRALSTVIPSFQPQSPGDLPASGVLYEENAIYEALEGKADALYSKYQVNKNTRWLELSLECHQLAEKVELQLRRSLQYESGQLGILAHSRDRAEKAIQVAWELFRVSRAKTYLYAAWTIAEQTKAAMLLEAVQRNLLRGDQPDNNPLVVTQRRLRRQIAYFERELLLHPDAPLHAEWQLQRNALMDEWSANERQIALQYPAWGAYGTQSAGLTSEEIAGLYRQLPGYAVVEYFVGKTAAYAFCQLPNGEAGWVQLAPPDTLSAAVQQLLTWMQSRTALQTPEPFLSLAHRLYGQLVQPVIAPFEGQFQQLLIIPDAWLAFLPFETLLFAPSKGASWAQAPCLLKKYPLHYAFSLAVMERQRQLQSGAKRHLLQLAPRFREQQRGLPPLLGGDEEVPAFGKQLFDNRADFEALFSLAPHYRIIHLSTHAGVDSAGALPSVELFDRTAYLPDIYALQLHADLVVLSACQTALGQFRQGEGVMSLSRAFAYAGAKGLVASLWTINEASTAYILRQMYTHLASGAPKPLALHQAKLDYLNDPAVPAFQKSPYFWAALTYVGDNGPVKWKRQQGMQFALLALVSLCCALGAFWWYRRRG